MKTKPKRITRFRTIEGLYRDPTHWIKGSWGRTYDGKHKFNIHDILVGTAQNARCFCLGGALYAVYPGSKQRNMAKKRLIKAITKLFPEHEHDSIVVFNDALLRTIKDIRRVVKESKV